MIIRIAIVLIVGSMNAVSAYANTVVAVTPSTSSVATINVKKCHVIDANNQSGFDVLAYCEKKELQEDWILGLRMSGSEVELCMMLQKGSPNYNWNDISHIHKNALDNECQIVTKDASAHIKSIQKKKVKRYHALDSSLQHNWEDAAKVCEKRSWKLASVESKEENAQVAALLNNDGYENNNYWISAYEPVLYGGFKWKYGERPLSYTNWAPGEPSRLFLNSITGHDRCVETWNQHSDFRWNDANCNILNAILCEEMIYT